MANSMAHWSIEQLNPINHEKVKMVCLGFEPRTVDYEVLLAMAAPLMIRVK